VPLANGETKGALVRAESSLTSRGCSCTGDDDEEVVLAVGCVMY